MKLTLLRLFWIRHASVVLVMGTLFAAFQFMLCTIVAKANLGGVLEALAGTLPPFFQELISSQISGGLSERGLLAFGWNHPVSHALGAAVAIVLAARAVAGEIETGAIELLLSQPMTRISYFLMRVVFACMALAFVSFMGVAGTLAGQALYGLDLFPAARLLRLGFQYFLLQVTWFAVVVAFSAYGSEGGRIALVGFLLALVSYFVQVISGLWPDAAFLAPWTLHHYFSPHQILLAETSQTWAGFTLLTLSLLGLGVAVAMFRRRDLP